VTDAAKLGECVLEAGDVLAGRRNPRRFQAVEDVFLLAADERRRRDGYTPRRLLRAELRHERESNVGFRDHVRVRTPAP
jgi:hypothetical protein